MALTRQEKIWDSGFGEDYNKRNDFGNSELDEVYIKDIGVRRTDMNEDFIGFLDREAKILEVGCNIGMQLVNLQEMGFKNLYGIEIQSSDVETAKEKTSGINIIKGSAYDIPFRDGYFDLVFSNRVLIHMNPDHLDTALTEIFRVSKKYIYGSEYYSENVTEIKGYHGETSIAWKRDFAGDYKRLFPSLNLLKEKKYKYTFNDDVDSTFLFEKQ